MFNEIRIFGDDYRIVELDEEHFHEQYRGTYNSRKRDITLSNALPEALYHETLLHEVIHAIDDALCINLTEEQVHVLGRGIFSVIRDNPWLGMDLAGVHFDED